MLGKSDISQFQRGKDKGQCPFHFPPADKDKKQGDDGQGADKLGEKSSIIDGKTLEFLIVLAFHNNLFKFTAWSGAGEFAIPGCEESDEMIEQNHCQENIEEDEQKRFPFNKKARIRAESSDWRRRPDSNR